MKIVGIDFKQLEGCTGGYDYILVIKDHFTYYTQAFATCNKSLKTNTKTFYWFHPTFWLSREDPAWPR